MTYAGDILIILASIAFVAFFSSSEASLLGVNKIRMQQMADKGHRGARAVHRVMGQHEKFFASILLTENSFIILGSSIGTALAISVLGDEGPAVAFSTVAMTILIVSLGEITPKTVALRFAERWAPLVAGLVELVMKIETPIIYLFTLPPRLIVRIVGGKDAKRPSFVSDEEIRTLISMGHRAGTVEQTEAKLLDGVFDFGDLRVSDVMVPRPKVVAIDQASNVSELLKLFIESPHSRFIVYKENIDSVVGIISAKDITMALAKGTVARDSAIDSLIRPAYFAPEAKRVSDLFTEMQEENYRMAVVVDEYGGTAGIVTLSLMLEEIVGPVGDELIAAAADKEFEVVDEHTYRIDGSMRVEVANEEMQLDFPKGRYETVAGFVLHLLGRIPEAGEELKYKDFRLVVSRMEGLKIGELLVTKEIHRKIE
jgi:putative hemolysin